MWPEILIYGNVCDKSVSVVSLQFKRKLTIINRLSNPVGKQTNKKINKKNTVQKCHHEKCMFMNNQIANSLQDI